jgi:iron complex outermembrane receptor protein
MKWQVLACQVSVTALLSGIAISTASAQGVANGATNTASPSDASQTNVPSDDQAAAAVGDIVVTAQRRSQQLIDVPLSVNVLSGQQLAAAGVTSTAGLQDVTPGLTFTALGGAAQALLRGVTTTNNGVGNPASVALYIDGVYISSQDTFNFDFVDVEQVQVLKGPQGTLYGRDATGGAILVTTSKPSFQLTARGSYSYGNFDTSRGDAYVSGPITEHLAVSVAGQFSNSDGYTTNITTNDKKVGKTSRYEFRGKVLFEPVDTMTFTLGGGHVSSHDNTGFLNSVFNGNSQSFRTHPGVVISNKPWEVNLTFRPIHEFDASDVTFNGDMDLGKARLNLVTGYRTVSGHTTADTDIGPFPDTSYSRTWGEKSFDQEINLSSNDSGAGLSWIVGAQYSRENARNDPIVFNTGPIFRNRTITNYYSGYLDLTYNLGEHWVVNAGIRYSDERKKFTGNSGAIPAAFVASSLNSDAWTPRASIRYSPSDTISIYASYNRGFKSGGYNNSTSNSIVGGVVTPFYPETNDSYEVGVKAALSRKVSFDVATFYSDYRNVQVSSVVTIGNVTTSLVNNAAAVEIYGIEGQFRAELLDGLTVRIGAAYTHGRYTDFPRALINIPIAGGGNASASANAKGYRLKRNPDFTSSAALEYKHETEFGEIFGSLNHYHSSGFYEEFDNRLHQKPYDTVNGRLGVGLRENAIRLSVYANNLTNNVHAALLLGAAAGDRINYAPPRTYGIKAEFRY